MAGENRDQTPNKEKMTKEQKLNQLKKQVERCRKCPLWRTRNKVVFGEGNPDSEIMFVGEAAGMQEDLQGRPFVGAAGKFLNEMLALIHFKRKNIYISNILKCRPPGNRDPLPDEVEACWPYLVEQIKIIKPKLIITLGRHALERFIPGLGISRVHGQPKRREIPELGKFIFYPLYHPAAALYRGNLKETLVEDFKKIPKVLEKVDELPEEKREETKEEVVEQKKLF